jgi:multidrug efflux pump subunit AcrB
VVTLAQFKEPAEVGNVIVRSTFEGPQIKVKDLAIVREDFEEESLITRVNGIKAITFLVYKKEGADAVRTADAVKRMIREEAARGGNDTEPGEKKSILEIIKGFFTGKIEEQATVRYGPVTISYANDISPQVRNRFQILLSNGAIGLVLVLVILAVFLNLKTAFWVAMGIPVSILGVCFFLPLFDSFLDSITLTAMILVMGIIVDDGIIISDNISRHREMGKAPLEAAVHGVQEVFLPVLTTVLTTILAFLPMFFMKGVMGQVVFVIPLTVCLALMISLYESTLALPAHLLQGMKKRAASGKGVHRKSMRSWFDTLRSFYRRFLLYLLKLRYLLVLLFVIVLAGSLWYAVKRMDFILFPTKGADRFFINVELPMGSSLAATSEKVKELEELVRKLPDGELENFITRVGIAGWPPIGQAENYAMIIVRLKPYSQRKRNADEIVESLRSRTDRLEGYVQIFFEVDSGGPPVGKAINLKVISTDDTTRNRLTDEVITLLGSIEGVKDVNRDDIRGKDQLEIDIDYSKLARLGLTVAEVARNVRAAYDGELVTSMRDGAEDLRFRVQLARKARRDERFLMNLPIPNQQGRLIRLGEAAVLRTGPGPNAYRHYQGERATTITADVDTDMTTPLKAATQVLSHLNLEKDWPEAEIIVGGEAGESRKSIVRLAVAFIIALLGIYFLLVLLFDSFTQPLLVIVAIPFGLTGVIITLALHGEPLGFLAMTGVIGLVGVVVNDSLVLVSHINELAKQKTGMGLRELVAQGTANRLRAILLTTLTTAAGVLPLAYGIGGYDLYMAPMALTLGYGLLFATPLTLVLVPSLYLIGSDMGRIFKRKRTREGDL